MKILPLFSLLAVSLTACVETSIAAEKSNAPSVAIEAAPTPSFVVAELFTSQGCSSCPQAVNKGGACWSLAGIAAMITSIINSGYSHHVLSK